MRVSVKEKTIEQRLCERVEAMGGMCVKVSATGQRGFFDRIVVLPGGRVIFVELKRPRGGRLSAHQIWYMASFSTLGAAIAVVKNHGDIDDLLGQ